MKKYLILTTALGMLAGTVYADGAGTVQYPNFGNPASDATSLGVGQNALPAQTGSNLYNTAVGVNTLTSCTTCQLNVAVGNGALNATATGSGQKNTAVGVGALGFSNGANTNTAVGYQAGYNTTTGSFNTLVGNQAGYQLTGGNSYTNTAIGYLALSTATISSNGNVAIGGNAGLNTTSGVNNTFVGTSAGTKITTGGSNVVIGKSVGTVTLTTGSNNILIGTSNAVDTPASSTSNYLNIGGYITATASNAVSIPGYANGTLSVSSGVITSSSDERFKNVLGRGEGNVFGLRPIVFSWKKDSPVGKATRVGNVESVKYLGFSAQEVGKKIPQAVSVGADGMLSLDDRAIIASAVNSINDLLWLILLSLGVSFFAIILSLIAFYAGEKK